MNLVSDFAPLLAVGTNAALNGSAEAEWPKNFLMKDEAEPLTCLNGMKMVAASVANWRAAGGDSKYVRAGPR